MRRERETHNPGNGLSGNFELRFRAIREKACGALADYKKAPSAYSPAAKRKKLSTRLEQIQTWEVAISCVQGA